MMSEEAKEARRLYKREYRQKNRDKILEYERQWRAKNPDKVKATQARYWEKAGKGTSAEPEQEDTSL